MTNQRDLDNVRSKNKTILFDIVVSSTIKRDDVIFATNDSRQLVGYFGKRAIIVTSIRDPSDAKRLRLICDFIIYQINKMTTERELRRIIDNKLCDMIFGFEQIQIIPGLHSQKILFNHVIATICSQNDICVLLNLRSVIFSSENIKSNNVDLNSSASYLSALLQRIRFIGKICEKYDVIVLPVTLAQSDIETRNPLDLQCFLENIMRPPKL